MAISLIITIMLVGCVQETYENGVPTYFTEPEGCVIAEISVDSSSLFETKLYGYITNEDYQAYLNGTLSGVLVVKNPYENGKEVSTPVNKIKFITIGTYMDIRY